MKNKIVLGAGCFWHPQKVFSETNGVIKTVVGYMGGNEKKFPNPTYEQVCSGKTGYVEVTEIEFDNKITTLEKILGIFWKIHDPTSINMQGADVGPQYKSVIFFSNNEQKEIAENSKKEFQKKLTKKIVTEILPAKTFYKAEDYHQNYLNKI